VRIGGAAGVKAGKLLREARSNRGRDAARIVNILG